MVSKASRISLQGMVAMVTGAASGLGRATAERMAREGCKVMVVDLPVSKGEEVASNMGNDAVFQPTDVSDMTTLLFSMVFF